MFGHSLVKSANKLGTGGHCLSITRTAVGPFVLDEAIRLDPLPEDLGGKLIPLDAALQRVGVNLDQGE